MTADGLTRVGKYAVSYEYRPTNPLSLRERVGVRVIRQNTYHLSQNPLLAISI